MTNGDSMESRERPQYVAGRKPGLECLESRPGEVEAALLRKGLQGKDVERMVELCRKHGIKFRFAPREELDRAFPGNHQGVLVEISSAARVGLEELLEALSQAPLPVIVALDQVQDPGNVGTLARTLYGLGGAGLLMPKHESARLGQGAARSAAGTLGLLPICRVTNLSQALDVCRERGVAIYGASGAAGAGDVFTAEPRFPCVLVLGNEDKGLRPGTAKRCDGLLRIPLARPLDSLNVAQAGAILLGRMAALISAT